MKNWAKYVLISVILLGTTAWAFGPSLMGFFAKPTDSASQTTTLLASDRYNMRPTPIDDDQITYIDSLQYGLAKGETHGFLLKVNTSESSIDLNCGGTDVADFECTFYKLAATYPDNSDKWLRASVSSSPASGTDAYWDWMGEIPTGSGNFVPEATSTDELIWVDIKAKTTATATTNADLVLNAGDDSINVEMQVYNWTVDIVPVQQTVIEISNAFVDDAHYGSYQSDSVLGSINGKYTDILKDNLVTAYFNSNVFLSGDGGSPEQFDLDGSSAAGGSWQQLILDKYHEDDWYLFWRSSPHTQSSHRTASYADLADQTVTDEADIANGQAMVYVYDEPADTTGVLTIVKDVLDNWDNKQTLMFLTTNAADDDSANATTVGLDFSDYTNLLLVPNTVEVDGSPTSITDADYTSGQTGVYTACESTCGADENTNGFVGSDIGYLNLTAIDYATVRARGMYWLVQRTNWRDKIVVLLHYASVQCHSGADGLDITPVADVSDSLDGTYFVLEGDNKIHSNSVCFWFDIDDSGTSQPGGACSSADANEEITSLATNATAAQVNDAILTAIDGRSEFVAYENTANDTINVVGGLWGGTQSAGTSGFTFDYDEHHNPWFSARRFTTMGDGCLIAPNIPGNKPWTGLDAFAKGNDDGSPSIRLKIMRDSMYEGMYLDTYHTREAGTPIADTLITDLSTYETDYGEYEYLRHRVGAANGAGNSITSHTLSASKLKIGTEPATAAVDATMTAFTASARNRLGAVDTAWSTNCTISIASGPGGGAFSSGSTTTVTPSSGVCTFDDVALDTEGTYTLTIASSGLTSVTTTSVTITAAVTDLNSIGTLAYWWNAENITTSGGDITEWDQLDTGETEVLDNSGSINDPAHNSSAINSLAAGDFDASNDEAAESALSPTIATSYILVVFKLSANTSARSCIVGAWDRFNDWTLSATSSKLVSVQVGSNQASWVDGSASADTNWHHLILVVRNSGNEEVWLDGASTKDLDTGATGAATIEAIRVGACGDMDVSGDGGGGVPDIKGDDVTIAEVAIWSALDMTGNGTGDEYEEVNDYVCDKYGSTMTGCP